MKTHKQSNNKREIDEQHPMKIKQTRARTHLLREFPSIVVGCRISKKHAHETKLPPILFIPIEGMETLIKPTKV